MRWYTELLFFGLFLVERSYGSNDNVQGPKIEKNITKSLDGNIPEFLYIYDKRKECVYNQGFQAIIGAGIEGAATAHFLTELFDRHLEIDIFEKHKIGGRLAIREVGDNLYEAGGAVIHPRNKYMKDFVKLLRLEKLGSSGEIKFGIWNGDEFVYKREDAYTMFKIYGEGNITKLFLVINELIEATLKENYGRHINVHSFVSLVSVAGAEATAKGELWSVKEGNENVPKRVIDTNPRVKVKFSKVTKIRYLLNEEFETKFEIVYESADSSGIIAMENIYDIVVIAAPLPSDERWFPEFENIDFHCDPTFRVHYQTTVSTFITGDINLSHFGLDESLDAILSCDQNKTEISSVGKLFPVNGPNGKDSRVWNVFSRKPLTSDQINSMFTQFDEIQEISWKAYPKYSVNQRSDKFELYDSLYHVNAIEWAASAMEMSVIGARNVALLIHKKLASCCQNSFAVKKKKCKYSCEGHYVQRGTRNVEL